MKKRYFSWLPHRITERQSAKKARNIKGNRLRNSRNTASRLPVALPSSASADCPHYLRTFQYASRLFCTIVCRKSDAPDVVECSKSPWNLLKKQQVRSEYAADHSKANRLLQETFSARRTSPAFLFAKKEKPYGLQIMLMPSMRVWISK